MWRGKTGVGLAAINIQEQNYIDQRGDSLDTNDTNLNYPDPYQTVHSGENGSQCKMNVIKQC